METWQYFLVGFSILIVILIIISVVVFTTGGGGNGACIKSDGSCTSTSFSNCIGPFQGTFYGSGLSCSDIGRCTMSNGSDCTNTTKASCVSGGGINVTFTPGTTCPIGACTYNTSGGMKCTNTTEGICTDSKVNNSLNGTFNAGHLCPSS